MPRRDELIWAAGFFDGEGCIGIYPNHHGRGGRTLSRPTLYLQISASQKTRAPLDILLSLFGGSVRAPSSHGHCYQWRASSNAAEKALRELLPHLRVKHEQAEVALDFRARRGAAWEAVQDRSADEDAAHELKRLKRVA